MAREVNTVLGQILAEQRGISEAKAEEIVKNMRAANQYQVRRIAYSHKSFATDANVYHRRMSGHRVSLCYVTRSKESRRKMEKASTPSYRGAKLLCVRGMCVWMCARLLYQHRAAYVVHIGSG